MGVITRSYRADQKHRGKTLHVSFGYVEHDIGVGLTRPSTIVRSHKLLKYSGLGRNRLPSSKNSALYQFALTASM